ncbi:MAG: CPBP family glutamic-type intramembrane protease [Lachnospiraceae bacterium]|nr:CPBP family glutamic-type intramembrane protease [Lachnospiraceae bacterium]
MTALARVKLNEGAPLISKESWRQMCTPYVRMSEIEQEGYYGLMHMNATQFVVGLLAGLLLGYIFTEYSIWWAFIFHVINNFGFTVLPEMLFPNVPSGDLNMYIYILLGVLSVIGTFIIVKRWPRIRAYFTAPENKAPKGSFGKVVSSPWFIIYVLIYAAIISLFMIFPESLNAIVSGTVPGLN